MENTAIYIQKLGTDTEPLSRIGLCPLQSVPSGPDVVFIVESPDAEKIYSLAGAVASPTMERPSCDTYDLKCSLQEAALSVMAACEVDIINSPPFRFRVRRDWVRNAI